MGICTGTPKIVTLPHDESPKSPPMATCFILRFGVAQEFDELAWAKGKSVKNEAIQMVFI